MKSWVREWDCENSWGRGIGRGGVKTLGRGRVWDCETIGEGRGRDETLGRGIGCGTVK